MNTKNNHGPNMNYSDAGVDTEAAAAALGKLLPAIRRTFDNRTEHGRPLLPVGFFANVIDVGHNLGIAISTDGVGTKLLIAQMMDKYDTVGIDCVAMNVNDVICVGAEPTAMTDYLAIEEPDQELFEELGKGLLTGACEAEISIPGGEISQISEMIQGQRPGRGFDLVGTCIGTVAVDRILVGQDIAEGDVVLGLASSGVHSNGLTLARHALLDSGEFQVSSRVPELGRTIGEELLEPTRIYVKFANALLKTAAPIKALIHITSDGLLNLTRVEAEVGYTIHTLPEAQPIFQMIQLQGGIPDEEMFRVFNMGIGLCVIVHPDGVKEVVRLAETFAHKCTIIGEARRDKTRTVQILPKRLDGRGRTFIKV